MSDSQNSPGSKFVAFCHGLGEILGFLTAALRAVVEIVLGRWPEVSKRRRRRSAASNPSEPAADQVEI